MISGAISLLFVASACHKEDVSNDVNSIPMVTPQLTAFVDTPQEPLSPQYTLSVKGLRKAYTKMYTKRPEFSQFGAFLCLKCRVHSCTPVYMKKPRHKAGAHCSPMQLWGFATMWCKGSEDFTESFLSLQESSLSN